MDASCEWVFALMGCFLLFVRLIIAREYIKDDFLFVPKWVFDFVYYGCLARKEKIERRKKGRKTNLWGIT